MDSEKESGQRRFVRLDGEQQSVYDDFYQKVIEAHIQPLKIKDSTGKG